MKIYFDFIAESINVFKTLFGMTVFAEEEDVDDNTDVGDNDDGDSNDNNDDGDSDDSSPSINYEDLIAKARKEEKQKLYPKIEKLEKRVEDLTEKNNKKVLQVGELNEQIETLENELESAKDKATQSDDERVTQLQSDLEEKESTIEDLQSQLEDTEEVDVEELRQEIEEEVKNEYEVKLYREKKIADAEGQVIPELVMGSTKEEIDETFEKAQERYTEIVGNNSNNRNTREGADNPSVNQDNLDINNLDIRGMSDEDYSQLRKRMGLGGNKRGTLR